MAIFDKLRKMQALSVDNIVNTSTNDGLNGALCTNIHIPYIPTSLDELIQLNSSNFKNPYGVAALTVVALCVYPYNKDIAIEMINYLKGPQMLTKYEMQFLNDRLKGRAYLPPSYLVGATPENNYTPQNPSSINIYKTSNSEDMLGEGYLQLYLKSGGTDTAMPVRLRLKPSTKEWFLWEYFILTDIRKPTSDSSWE